MRGLTLRYRWGGSRAPATATGSQCTSPGREVGSGARSPPQERGAPEVGKDLVVSSVPHRGCEPLLRPGGSVPKVLSGMFGAPPHNGRGCKRYSGQGVAPKMASWDAAVRPLHRIIYNRQKPPLRKEVGFGNPEVDHKMAAQS